MEFGESPEEALLRELAEETGLSANIFCPLQTWNFFREEETQIVGITFLCKAETNKVQLSSEHDDFAWVRFEEIPQYNIVPSVLSDLKKLDMGEIHARLDRFTN